MRTKFSLFVFFLVAAFILSACGPAASAQPHSLSVTGAGTVSVTPDIAYINVGVHTENADLATSVSQNNTQTQALIDYLKSAGIAADDIQTSNFNVYTNSQGYDKVTGQPTDAKTFVVDNSVYVTVRDISKIGSLLSAGITAGANNINGITFDLADKSKAFADARQKALADAGSVAAELAKNAGLKLGGIQSISYTNNSSPVPLYGMGGGGSAQSLTSVPVQPGKTQIAVTVDVIYELK
jgi:uncharacterized protein